MLRFLNSVYCKIASHDLVEAGSCPFTGQHYYVCLRCDTMVPLYYVD